MNTTLFPSCHLALGKMYSCFSRLCFFMLWGLMLTLWFTQTASAQITTGGLKGKIKNGEQMLADANVELVNEETGARFTTTTDKQGNFVFFNIDPGAKYKVTAHTAVGTIEREEVVITLGENASLTLDLSEAQPHSQRMEGVEIVARKDFNRNKTGATTLVKTKTIMEIPAFNRSLGEIAALTPQANGLSMAGANNRFNNITIDGAISNDAFGLGGGNGLPGAGVGVQPISLDAISEMQVVLSPYSVLYGNFTGGGINAVTRSGKNKMEGSAYFFTKNSAFTGPDPLTKQPTSQFSEYTAGARLGGAIIKNKLFYFVSYEYVRRSTPTLFNAGDPGAISIDSARFIADVMRTKYGYDVGGIGATNLVLENHKALAKIDWNINTKHKLSFRYNVVVASQEFLSRSRNSFTFGGGMTRNTNLQNVAVLQLNSSISSRWHNQLILSYTSIQDRRNPLGAYFPRITMNSASSGNIAVGSDPVAKDNILNQNIVEITNNLRYTLGKYTFTIGTHNEFFFLHNSFINRQNGAWTLRNGNVADWNNLDQNSGNNIVQRFQAAYPVQPGGAISKFGAAQLSLYLQAEASYFQDRLKMYVGIRGDVPLFFSTPIANADFDHQYGIKTNQTPARVLYSPRFGFNLDADGNKIVIVRGGVGLFAGRVPFVWMSNGFANDGIRLATVDVRNNPPNFNPNMAAIPGFSNSTSYSVNVLNQKLKFPQILRANLATDIQIPGGVKLTLEAIFTQTLNNLLMRRLDIDTTQSRVVVPNSGGMEEITPSKTSGQVETAAGAIDPTRSYGGGVYMLDNTSRGYSYNLTAQLSKTFKMRRAGRLSLMAAYTYTRAFDVNSNGSSVAASNFSGNYIPANTDFNNPALTTSAYELRHRVIATLTYSVEYARHFGTSVFLFLRSQSGSPYSLTYSNFDLNGDGWNGNDVLFIPTIAQINATSSLNAQQKQALTNFVNDPTLAKYQGKYLPRNALTSPWTTTIDLRILQNFIVRAKKYNHIFQLSFEIFNLPNLLNNNWGRQYSAFVSQPWGENGVLRNNASTRQPMTLADTYSVTFDSRWQMQLGFRYIF